MFLGDQLALMVGVEMPVGSYVLFRAGETHSSDCGGMGSPRGREGKLHK